MNKKIVIDIAFNVWFHDVNPVCLTKEWIDYRINIFMKYTGRNLMNQTNQSFLCILRYDKSTEDLVFDALSKYPKLPDNIIFTCEGGNVINKYINGSDYLYLVRLDCDDLYHPDVIDKLDKFPYRDGLECIICQYGYGYDSINNILSTRYDVSPPFYTLIYKTNEYLNGFRYTLKGGHTSAKYLNHEVLNGRNYLIVLHDKNLLNKFYCNLLQKVITNKNEINSVLEEFKIG